MANQQRFHDHHLSNMLHTLLILGAIFGLTGFLGWMIWGPDGLFWAMGAALLLMLLTPRLSPTTLLRLYRARPLAPTQAPALHGVLRELALRAGLEATPGLFVIPSPVMNAFAVGSGRQSGIALTHGLLRSMDLRELAGILAHELSHIRNNDLGVMTLADTASRITAMFSTLGQVLLFINLPLLLSGRGTIPFLPIVILILAPLATSLLQLALSRSREFEADLQAVQLTGDPLGLARALARMERTRASLFDRILLPGRREPEPSILRTHPETEDRIRRLRELAESGDFDSMLPMDFLRQSGGVFRHGDFPRPLDSPRWRIGGFWY